MSTPPFGAGPPVLRCGRCGRFVDWADSRLQLVCGCRPHLELPPVLVRDATPAERAHALDRFARDFGAHRLVAYGQVVPLDDVPVLVAEIEREIAGALAWRPFDGAFHILALATDPMWQRAGVGGHLVAEAELLARRQGHPRIIATIGNDNIPALYFYQRRGYRVSAILRDAVAAHARGQHAVGFAGIPLLDEIQLAKDLP
ncbi:MAG: GNAT family N-acetyltransferase [Acidobacteria bacterium]|nr:GNAT family N-acetyltransferase [Acidobacteriota bacterium]